MLNSRIKIDQNNKRLIRKPHKRNYLKNFKKNSKDK